MPSDLRPNPDVVSQELDGEMVLVHLTTNQIFALNETGARLWLLLQAGHGLETIRDELGREFDVDQRQLEQDMEALIADLAANGLVIRSEP